MLQNMNHPTGKHACKVCGLEIKRLCNLARHVKSAHGIVSKDICMHCTPTKQHDTEETTSSIEESAIDYDTDEDSGEDESIADSVSVADSITDVSSVASSDEDDVSSVSSSDEDNVSSVSSSDDDDDDDTDIWKDFLEETSSDNKTVTKKNQLKYVLRAYAKADADTKLLVRDPIHKEIVKEKRKFDREDGGADDAWQRAYKKRKLDIENAVFSYITEESDATDEVDYEDNTSDDGDAENDNDNELWHMFLEKKQ